uniref:Uncharacterized protein n=1 Tax=Kalanchoe fedtschenkoi TaxID=63787 RepID=A0A7N0SW66_KALFE
MRSCTTTLTAQAKAGPTSIPRGAGLVRERGNIACHNSKARSGTLLREGRLASRASREEAFWRSQVNFGPPNCAIKGSVYVVTLPAFQRCLEDGPDAAERRPVTVYSSF